MKKFLLVSVFTLLLLVIQTSVFPPFFSETLFPQVALMAAVGSTIVFGFNRVLVWLVVAGAIFDIRGSEIVGPQVILFVLSAYIVSFLSKRLLVEHKAWSQVIILSFILLVTLLHRIYLLVSYSAMAGLAVTAKLQWLLYKNILTEIIANCILFFLFYWIFKKREKIFLLQ